MTGLANLGKFLCSERGWQTSIWVCLATHFPCWKYTLTSREISVAYNYTGKVSEAMGVTTPTLAIFLVAGVDISHETLLYYVERPSSTRIMTPPLDTLPEAVFIYLLEPVAHR